MPLMQVEIVRELGDPRIVERVFQPGDVEFGEMQARSSQPLAGLAEAAASFPACSIHLSRPMRPLNDR